MGLKTIALETGSSITTKEHLTTVKCLLNNPSSRHPAQLNKVPYQERLFRAASAFRLRFTLGFSYLSRRFISDNIPAF
jgi:hypothetical protein